MSEQTKEKVRAMFPQCVAVADELRDVFGPGVKLIYARENGVEIGTPLDDASPEKTLTPAQMVLEVPEEEPKRGHRYG